MDMSRKGMHDWITDYTGTARKQVVKTVTIKMMQESLKSKENK